MQNLEILVKTRWSISWKSTSSTSSKSRWLSLWFWQHCHYLLSNLGRFFLQIGQPSAVLLFTLNLTEFCSISKLNRIDRRDSSNSELDFSSPSTLTHIQCTCISHEGEVEGLDASEKLQLIPSWKEKIRFSEDQCAKNTARVCSSWFPFELSLHHHFGVIPCRFWGTLL